MEQAALEAELSRIPGVTATRVVVDDDGAPSEIHVLAGPDKPAKQVVRDVQSVALARFDLELDRRIVSVVQLESPPPGTAGDEAPRPGRALRAATGEDPAQDPAQDRAVDRAAASGAGVSAASAVAASERAASAGERAGERTGELHGVRADPALRTSRVTLIGVSVSRDGHRQNVEVTLSWRGNKAVGWEAGAATASGTYRQVALATLAALHQIDPATEATDVETATVARLGHRDVASVTLLVLDPPREELLCGTALVGGTGASDAVARAVLDALNRRLGAARPGG